MRRFLSVITLGGVILLFSCSGEEEQLVKTENFYMNFSLGDTAYSISNDAYQLNMGSFTLACGGNFVSGTHSPEEYVYGMRSFTMENPTETSFISSLSVAVSKKIYKDELDANDEGSYMNEVLHADNFGFPVNNSGFYSVYDLENEVFIVDRNSQAEAYFFLTTQDEEVYRSTSVVPNERDVSSFFTIKNIIEIQDTTVSEYQYIIEGEFRVNMFRGFYGTDSEMMVGEFRWPVSRIATSELLNVCE